MNLIIYSYLNWISFILSDKVPLKLKFIFLSFKLIFIAFPIVMYSSSLVLSMIF